MPWFKVDDAIHSHPKFIDLPMSAVGLWTIAGAWCAQYLTDGLITTRQVRRLGAEPEDIDALLDVGLWVEVEGGYQFHDWGDYQPTRESVEEDRAKARARMARARAAKSPRDTTGTTPDRSPERAPDVRANTRRSSDNPDPTRPDPEPNGSEGDTAPAPPTPPTPIKPSKPTRRATRLPEGWEPSPDVIQAMATEHPQINLEAEHRKFTDHFQAAPDSKARKTDWDATWRNWIRRAADYAPRNTTGNRHIDRAINAWGTLHTPTSNTTDTAQAVIDDPWTPKEIRA